MIGIRDDDGRIRQVIGIVGNKIGMSKVKEIICYGLLMVAKENKNKFSNYELDIIDSFSSLLFRDSNKEKSLQIWKARNAVMIIIEMILKGVSYDSIDEKRSDLLKQLEFNRHNPQHKKILDGMNHKIYAEIKSKSDYLLMRGFNLTQVKALGYEGIVKVREGNKVIDIKPVSKGKKK